MKLPRLLMIVGALLLAGVFFFPTWNIRLEAPQYPIPLGMNIHINKMVGERPHDIKNINLMNHYVGMKYIPEHMDEFEIFPAVVITMIVLGVLIGFFAPPIWFLIWFIAMSLLGTAGMYDFYSWGYDYGHNLDPKAIMNFKNPDGTPMGFQPPLFGTKHILNFTAHSYPRNGAFFIFGSLGMTFFSYWVARRANRKAKPMNTLK